MIFLQNKKSTLSYIVYMGPKEGLSLTQRMTDLSLTLNSLYASRYYEDSTLRQNEQILVAPASVSIINSTGLGDQSVFSIIEEFQKSEMICDFRIEYIKDPQEEYMDNMDEIFYPGKMTFVASDSDFYYEKCLNISVESLPSRPVLFSVLNDGDTVDSNHIKQTRDLILDAKQFVALVPEGGSTIVPTIVTSFYYRAFQKNPNNTLMDSLEKTAQEYQCEEMIIKT